MNKNIPLIIFGYAFPHKKTHDFVSMLFAKGFRNMVVVGAPKLLMGNKIINQKKIILRKIVIVLKTYVVH